MRLAVAISERVKADHSVHHRDLIGGMTAVLRHATVKAKARQLEVVRGRALFDAKWGLAMALVATAPRGLKARQLNEAVFWGRRGIRWPFITRMSKTRMEEMVGTLIDDLTHAPPTRP